MLHAITWCERAYDPYLVKSSRSGADHSVAIRLQTAEIGHHPGIGNSWIFFMEGSLRSARTTNFVEFRN